MSSYWIDRHDHRPSFPAFDGSPDKFDVAVLGGGIVGVTTALRLKQAGAKVALIEAGRVGASTTGHSTAKLTVAHALLYESLKSSRGADHARNYAAANSAAIELVASLVRELSIDCSFERRDAYVFSEDASKRDQLEKEAAAAQSLGLPAEYADLPPSVPFPVAGSVRYSNQAQLDPYAYVAGLAEAIDGNGCHVFEHTRANDVDEHANGLRRVKTDHGDLIATDVVVATHYPFLDRGLMFARTSVKRAYAIATEVDGVVPDAMLIGVDSTPFFTLTQRDRERTIMLFSGADHRVGQNENTFEPYELIRDWADQRFSLGAQLTRWSTQDPTTTDGVPYVGKLRRTSDHLWVASGFAGWGLSNGTAAGMMLSDAIAGRKNPWLETFDPHRLTIKASAKKFVQHSVETAVHFVGDRLGVDQVDDLSDLQRGEGRIVTLDGERLAVSRAKDGKLEAVSPRCTHMGCYVQWNDAETSWDCPCHGSRFKADGSILEGPAVEPLASKDLALEQRTEPSPTRAKR